MKKIICTVLAVALCALVCSCTKDESIESLEIIISELGEASIENSDTIRAADAMYDGLTAKQQKRVKNASILLDKVDTLNEIELKIVEDAILAIGNVKLDEDDQKSIDNARKAYDEAHEDVRKAVTYLNVLENAEEKIEALKIEYVEEKINEIGEITLSSGIAINKAKNAYALYPEVQDKISNYDKLHIATEKLLEVKIAYVEGEIDKIGTVTNDAETEARIKVAEDAYENNKSDVEGLISNYDDIAEAWDTYYNLKVNTVVEAIDAIGTVTAASQYAIFNANYTYDKNIKKLREVGRAIPNEDVLKSAKEEYLNIVRTEGKAAFEAMKTETEKDDSITWYFHRNLKRYTDANFLQAYIGNNTIPRIRGLAHCHSKNEFTVDKIVLNVDGESRELNFNDGTLKHDSTAGEYWMHFDYFIAAAKDGSKSDSVMFLNRIAYSENATVTFSGPNFEYVHTVTENDKKVLADTILAYYYIAESEILLTWFVLD